MQKRRPGFDSRPGLVSLGTSSGGGDDIGKVSPYSTVLNCLSLPLSFHLHFIFPFIVHVFISWVRRSWMAYPTFRISYHVEIQAENINWFTEDQAFLPSYALASRPLCSPLFRQQVFSLSQCVAGQAYWRHRHLSLNRICDDRDILVQTWAMVLLTLWLGKDLWRHWLISLNRACEVLDTSCSVNRIRDVTDTLCSWNKIRDVTDTLEKSLNRAFDISEPLNTLAWMTSPTL